MGKENENEQFYKNKIIEMIKKMENIYFLRAIYVFIESLTEQKKKAKGIIAYPLALFLILGNRINQCF